MSTRLSQPDREKLRRDLGLLTVNEAAAVLACSTVDIARQIAFGVLAHHADGTGQLLVSQADVHGYAAQSCPGLDSTPKVTQDGWLESRPGERTSRSEFIKALKSDPQAYHSVSVGRYSLGQAFIASECLANAKSFAQKLPTKTFDQRSLAEKFYSIGPVKFSAFKVSCRSQILNAGAMNIGSDRVSLAAIARNTFARDVAKVLSEVF